MDDSKNPFFVKPREAKTASQKLMTYFQGLVVIVVVTIVVYIFAITPNQVDGFSMYPTFDNNEILLTNRLIQWANNFGIADSINLDYVVGDVIVFYSDAERKNVVKRVIATEGTTIKISNGQVFLNGSLLIENYLSPDVKTQGNTFLQDGQDYTLLKDEFFTMGDNRTKSIDSRFMELGPIKRKDIIGKVFLRLFPLNTITPIGTGEYTLIQN